MPLADQDSAPRTIAISIVRSDIVLLEAMEGLESVKIRREREAGATTAATKGELASGFLGRKGSWMVARGTVNEPEIVAGTFPLGQRTEEVVSGLFRLLQEESEIFQLLSSDLGVALWMETLQRVILNACLSLGDKIGPQALSAGSLVPALLSNSQYGSYPQTDWTFTGIALVSCSAIATLSAAVVCSLPMNRVAALEVLLQVAFNLVFGGSIPTIRCSLFVGIPIASRHGAIVVVLKTTELILCPKGARGGGWVRMRIPRLM